jgi:hypothetical protein
MRALSEVVELACLHLKSVVVVDDVVPGLEAAVVEVLHRVGQLGFDADTYEDTHLCLVDPRIVVVRER